MPRIAPQLIRSALSHSPELAALLPACRDLNSAFNELRWIREHVDKTVGFNRKRHLEKLCQKRGRGVPLQYLLGTQPFGSLNIKCKPGVLIPRPETEAYVCYLQDLLESGNLLGQKLSELGNLRIIDFCTGTGCIPLHLFSTLQRSVRSLEVCGVDISLVALELAKENAKYNVAQGYMASSNDKQALSFQKADIFRDTDIQQFTGLPWDIMISNPPYISRNVWNYGRGQMGYSTRKYEPRLALVPEDDMPPAPAGLLPEDIFYARLLDLAQTLCPKILLMEVGDEKQARRIVQYCSRHTFCTQAQLTVWRDWPDVAPGSDKNTEDSDFTICTDDGKRITVPVKGSGNIRSIVITTII
ncbi:unnamed protein product [Clonostachys solani]|uniref:peptide chain release factor N(5)-glutamine methyltransferase n=1 Tax=Clonostachys solani TaxID=160281 RepID=A0A9N9ZCX7_9HYPO|nr:unnamed protein product [Clonostachys solani]